MAVSPTIALTRRKTLSRSFSCCWRYFPFTLLLMLLGLSCFNVEFQARFFTLLFHPHLILKCNMSPNEVCVVCPSHSHPFINLGVILGSTLLAIHSNPIICPLHPHCRYLSIPSVPRSLQKPKAPAPSPSSLVIQNLHHTNRASMNA